MIDKEIWKWIPKYKGYYKASTYGRIKSVSRWRKGRKRKDGTYTKAWVKGQIMKPRKHPDGHLYVGLRKDGLKQRNYFIHQLVLKTFVGECPEGKESRHYPDRNPANNRLSNLSYASPKRNQKDRIAHGTSNRGKSCNRGDSHPQRKLNHQKSRKILRLYETGNHTYESLGLRFGVHKDTIGCIIRGTSWK